MTSTELLKRYMEERHALGFVAKTDEVMDILGIKLLPIQVLQDMLQEETMMKTS